MIRMMMVLLVLLVLLAHASHAHGQQTVRYIHTDSLGSVVAVTNEQGAVVERREYEPYGYQQTPVVADGPGYTGHVQDAATGLTYMQQRYYDPKIGRFLSVDPVTMLDIGDARHFNRFAYAYNSPYNYTDPDGRCPWCVVGAVIGVAANMTAQMLSAEGSMSERLSQVEVGQVVIAGLAGAASGGLSTFAGAAAATAAVKVTANVAGNAAIGAVATHASAAVEGRSVSAGDVAAGAGIGAAGALVGAAAAGAASSLGRSSSAAMSQTERAAMGNLFDGIKSVTPGLTPPSQPVSNAIGAGTATATEQLLDRARN